MRPILAIALLSLRNAIRSKMVVCLLLVLALVIVLIPLTIKGDGTMAGFVQILLSYTLGLSSTVLAMTTFWVGSASVSSEINDKTIQTLGTKPVSTWQIWMGKWIGLNVMNILLVVCCGSVTYGMVKWHLHPSRLSTEQQEEVGRLLKARLVVQPEMPDINAMAESRLRERMQMEPLPAGTSQLQALREIRQQLMAEANTIRPAASKQWNFGTISAAGDNPVLTLQYRFATSVIGQGSVNGRWLIGTRERPDLISLNKTSVPQALNELYIPYDPIWQHEPLLITFVDQDSSGATLLIDLNQGLVLLVPKGAFAANFARALLTIAGQMSFYAALGVTAGCMFSLPVAAFVSMFLLFLIQMGSYIQGMAMNEITLPGHGESAEQAMTWGTVIVAMVFKLLALILTPLVQESSLNQLSTGVMISIAQTLRTLLLQGILYSLIMGLFASYVMNRREMALPQS